MFCPRCGIENTEDASQCHGCGENLVEGRSGICPNCGIRNDVNQSYCRDCGTALPGSTPFYKGEPVYAGFWLRFVASFIDGLVMMLFLLPFWLFLVLPLFIDSESLASMEACCYCLYYIAVIVIPWQYFAKMESSPRQATWGKSAVGIIVTDMDGKPITFGKASGRHFAKYLSTILYIGYIMAGFTEKKQGLHDMMAGCLVVMKEGRK